MRLHTLERHEHVRAPLEAVFEFFADPLNLARLTPPWLGFRIIDPEGIKLGPGTLIAYRLRVHGLPIRWLTRIERWDPPHQFTDIQLKGPYRYWHHTHEFARDGDGTSITDTVRYAMRAGRIGELIHDRMVEPDIAKIFDYRRQEVERAFPRKR